MGSARLRWIERSGQHAPHRSPPRGDGTARHLSQLRIAWANLCNTPWRLYKHYTHEGGISGPCIAHWPTRIRAGIDHRPWHFIDMLPTLASVAGAPTPPGIAGVDMSAAFTRGRTRRGPIFWEHEGSRAVREGKWKLTAVSAKGEWELYDIEADRSELRNLAFAEPARVRKMAARWEAWAKQNNVIPWIWEPQFRGSISG